MLRLPFRASLLGSVLTATLVLATAWLAPRAGFAQATVNPNDLLKSMPFDRITLIDGLVVTIDPVSPRPLPVYDVQKEARNAAKRKAAEHELMKEGNVFLPGKEPKLKKGEDEVPSEIIIHRIEPEPGDFRVKRNSIKKVEYYEDMLLAEAERLILERNYAKAFEHCLLVKARVPNWKGLEDTVQHLLYEEGTAAMLLDNDVERGLRLLRDLHARNPVYPGLADRLAAAYGGRIARAFENGAYLDARRVLHDLELLAPNHTIVREAKERFSSKAQGLVDKSDKTSGMERLDLVMEAVRIWPKLSGADAKFKAAFEVLPTLDVGVVDIARPVGPWIRSPADDRASRLVYLPLLAQDSEEAARGRLPGQLAADLQVGDLGRRINLALRDGAAWSDGSRSVSAVDVVRSLSDRAVPGSNCFNARWADFLDRVEASDEHQVVVRFTRAPLKPEAWLLGPVGPAHTGRDGQGSFPDGARRPIGDGPYSWLKSQGEMATYIAAPVSGKTPAPKIRRVREVRIPGGQEAVAALLRGDVSMLAHVSPERVAELAKEEGITVGHYERPALHRIAFDGRTPALRNRTLRRGLSYAIDRKTLLEETVLRRPVDEINRPSDGAFTADSYANATDVEPLPYDPLLAKMLVAAARREIGVEAIRLTLEYPAIPEVRLIVPKLVEALNATGVVITPVERLETELEEGLRSGRRFDLVYRVSRCGEPVADAGPLLCPGYDAPPSREGLASIASPRILQLLLQLEHAADWPTARTLVAQVDREVRDELPILPLWQLRDHYAWRSRLKGPKDATDHLYQDIEQWEIEPWFAQDPW
jgi:peptide/nickel transport system substrate-binding protein